MRTAVASLLTIFFCASLDAQDGTATTSSAESWAGTWSGEWRTDSGSGFGSMVFELSQKGSEVTGRARAAIRGDCSNSWEPLAGHVAEGKMIAAYNLGGRCGKVDLVLTPQSDGTVIGIWKSEFPSSGSYALKKQPLLGPSK